MKKVFIFIIAAIGLLALLFITRAIYAKHEIAELRTMIQAGDATGVFRLVTAHPQLLEADMMSERQAHASPLSFAAGFGQETVCSNLLAAGANVNSQDKFGQTPLHQAVKNLNPNIVRLMVKFGANTHIQNGMGNTPIDIVNHILLIPDSSKLSLLAAMGTNEVSNSP
jgi:ankyrin repeat protein